MTTADDKAAKAQPNTRFRLPDLPEKEPDEVTAFDQIYDRGMLDYLAVHFGNRDTTLVTAGRWIMARLLAVLAGATTPTFTLAASPQKAAVTGLTITDGGNGGNAGEALVSWDAHPETARVYRLAWAPSEGNFRARTTRTGTPSPPEPVTP